MLGDKIKYCRERKELTIHELAKKAECSPSTIYYAENEIHDIRIDNLAKIAGVLEVSIDWLLDRSKSRECSAKPDLNYESKIKNAIKEKGVSLKWIARKSGVTVDTVHNFKSKETYAYTLNAEAICDVLNISLDWLFGRKEQMGI